MKYARINCWERLAWVGAIRRESTGEERAETLFAINMQGTNRSGDRREEPAMWQRIWGTTINRRETRRAKGIHGMGENEKTKKKNDHGIMLWAALSSFLKIFTWGPVWYQASDSSGLRKLHLNLLYILRVYRGMRSPALPVLCLLCAPTIRYWWVLAKIAPCTCFFRAVMHENVLCVWCVTDRRQQIGPRLSLISCHMAHMASTTAAAVSATTSE